MTIQLTFLFCFAGAAAVACVPAAKKHLIRIMTLAFLGASALVSVALFANYPGGQSGFTGVSSIPWIKSLGISFTTGVDGVSVSLLLMTGVVSVAAVLMSWNVETRVKEFFIHILILTGSVYGVFVSLDLLLLFLFYEISIIPKYFLIALWGGARKEYAAMKLVLYSFLGSLVALLGLLIVYATHYQLTGVATFDLRELTAAAGLFPGHMSFICLPLFFTGFGILAGLYPFHTWAPTGHTAAPTAASMLLAGVIMKLGAYGCLRLGIGLTGEGFLLPANIFGLEMPHFWTWIFAGAGIIAIVLGAGSSLVQKDMKFIVAYSSVSHMGFVILGLALANFFGVTGAVLQMISHGFIAALLFACVGRLIYDRTHTRMMGDFPRFALKEKMPLVCVITCVAFIASAGMPGFSGFIAEFTVFRGLIEKSLLAGVPVILGVLVTFAYSLKVLHGLFWKEENTAENQERPPVDLLRLTWPEKTGALILIVAIVWMGVMPGVLTSKIAPNVRTIVGHESRVDTPESGGIMP